MFDGGFYWWHGVVEDRDDSKSLDGLKLGRVRVRILGLHSPFRIEDNDTGEGIPTSSLHWAYPMMPINNAGMNGIGESPTGVVEGTNVFGFARDGKAFQDLVIMGVFGGVPQVRPNFNSEGFSDPNGVYPKASHLGEPDTNRLARAEKLGDTIVQQKKDSRITSVPIAFGGTWSQPAVPYNTTYPYNHVRETESGHVLELDDTPGNERWHQWHKSGTFFEIDKLGTKVETIVKDNYSIILGSDYVHIVGSCNIHIGGNANMVVEGSLNAEVKGDVNTKTDGNETHTVSGNYVLTAARIDLN